MLPFKYDRFKGDIIDEMPNFVGFRYRGELIEMEKETVYLSMMIRILEPENEVEIPEYIDEGELEKGISLLKSYGKFQRMIIETNKNEVVHSRVEFKKIVKEIERLREWSRVSEFGGWLLVQEYGEYEKELVDELIDDKRLKDINTITEWVVMEDRRSVKMTYVFLNENLWMGEWIIENYGGMKEFNTKMELVGARCLKGGKIESVKWLYERGYMEISNWHLELAGGNGRYECLEWLLGYREGVEFDYHYGYDKCFKEIISKGHIECAKLLYSMDPEGFKKDELIRDVFISGLRTGKLELIDWIYNIKPFNLNERNNVIGNMVYREMNIDLMEWLLSKTEYNLWENNGLIFKEIMRKKNLEFMEYVCRKMAMPIEFRERLKLENYDIEIQEWILSLDR